MTSRAGGGGVADFLSRGGRALTSRAGGGGAVGVNLISRDEGRVGGVGVAGVPYFVSTRAIVAGTAGTEVTTGAGACGTEGTDCGIEGTESAGAGRETVIVVR